MFSLIKEVRMNRFFACLTIPVLFLSACNLTVVSPTDSVPSITPSLSTITITVYFTYLPNFQVGTEPYEKAVTRTIPSVSSLPEAVLEQMFLGPTSDEKTQGLDAFFSGATGLSKLTVEAGIARVYLTGDCNSKGAAYTVANLIDANLRQFPEIKWVKIYDQNGETETPDGQSGSIPFCLEP
jgi:hypothetical protein